MYGLHGAVLFSLNYVQTTKRLTVVLFKAQNLNLASDDNQGISVSRKTGSGDGQ